ncbi:hypothetical protein M422DRAFT_262657 [Sphaerobolus stellatus SS14]|uniref:Uncharacterized protein n=1 Tax=Sphaerobolus stellatus (strain SS14) TaxID=990650 RepID=A0A0C9V0E4_SPHS4|nr:hypothetical protein M422DRAFT_262657 [Sphaerobolus stellatus SS14]
MIGVPPTCVTPIVDCIIANYPSLIQLHLTIEENVAVPSLLHRGHWPDLKRIALEFDGSLFDPTVPILDIRQRANIMANFLRRNTELESFWMQNQFEYYPGCLPEGHASLQKLNL